MQRVCLLVGILFVASVAWAGAPRACPHELPTFKAPNQQKPSVTVRSITMAPGRKSATIEIVNQSTKTITAYGYGADIAYTDGVHCVSETMHERIGDIAFAEAGIHFVPLPDQQPIKPGEVRSEVFHFNEPEGVAGLAITVEVVIYSDQTAESTNQWMLDHFIQGRTEEAERHSIAVEAITAAMQDEHPFKSAHDRLLKVKHDDSDIRNLEPGYGRTFANLEEERKYLAKELADHRSLAGTLTAHAKIVGHQ